jgi:NAD-dependent deacetylase
VFATWEGLFEVLASQPKRAAEFVRALVEPILNAEPNAAHRAVAELEKYKSITVVTQNIDGLHEAAGSSRVYAVHGRLYETVTFNGSHRQALEKHALAHIVSKLHEMEGREASAQDVLAALRPLLDLESAEPYRPNLVMFGDVLSEPDWTLAQQAVAECDCLISIGTSGSVYPAATLPLRAKSRGAAVLGIDPEQGEADVWIAARAGTAVPALVEAATR